MDEAHWEVPYLPIDPADVGSSYQEVVRVNSQSGKGGVGFVLEQRYGISLPREMLVEFSKVVQALTEELDREVRADEIMGALVKEYLVDAEPYRLIEYDLGACSRRRPALHSARSRTRWRGSRRRGGGPGPSRRLSTPCRRR